MARRTAWLLLACSIPAFVALLVLRAPATAHTTLLQASPAPGNESSPPPEEVRLRFDEPVDGAFDPVRVFDAGGNRVDRDDARPAREDARVLVAGLEELPEGPYRVEWRVASLDGHVVSGSYGFAVAAVGGAPAGAENEDEGSTPRETARGNGAGLLGALPRTLVYGVLSLGALALVALLAVLGTRLARQPDA